MSQSAIESIKGRYLGKLRGEFEVVLPRVLQYDAPPPYTGEKLQQFLSHASDEPASGWLFLQVYARIWAMRTDGNNHQKPVYPYNLLFVCGDVMQNLWFDKQAGVGENTRFTTKLAVVRDVLTRIMTPLTSDSIRDMDSLRSEFNLHGINPDI